MQEECSGTFPKQRQDASEHLVDVADRINRVGSSNIHHPVKRVHVDRGLVFEVLVRVWRHFVLIQEDVADELHHLLTVFVDHALAFTISILLLHEWISNRICNAKVNKK